MQHRDFVALKSVAAGENGDLWGMVDCGELGTT